MNDDVIGKAYDARLMRRLLVYLRPHVAAVAVAFRARSSAARSSTSRSRG